MAPPSSFRTGSGYQASSTGGERSASSTSSRPLSILSTFSSHRREAADVLSPTGSTSTLPAVKRRDSRGLHSATMSKNFEDELNSGGTRHLKSDSVGSGTSSNGTRRRKPSALDGSPDSDDYEDGDDYYEEADELPTGGSSHIRDQEILEEDEDEPPSPGLPHTSGHTRTPASAPYAFKQPSKSPAAYSSRSPSAQVRSLPTADPRSRTSSAETSTALPPKPPQLPTFPSGSSSVYSTASAAPETGLVPAPPGIVPVTPTTGSANTRPDSPYGAQSIYSRRGSGGSQVSHDGSRGKDPASRVLGLDDDVDAKRRSLMRGGGTASSPDLATLVRKKREARAAAAADPPEPLPVNEAAPPTPEKNTSYRQRESSDPSSARAGPRAGGRPANLSERNTSGQRRPSGEEILGDDWVRGFDLSPGETAEDRLPGVAGVRAIGLGFGNIEKEGFNKSMRNKAKNVFSKMFAPISPARPQTGSSSSHTGSLRLPPSASSSSLSPQSYQPTPSIYSNMSRRSSAATTTTPKGPNALLPLGPPLSASPGSPPRLYERRQTEPSKKELPPISGRSPERATSSHLSPGEGRRRSLSFGGMSGTKGWETDVEGLFDGIADEIQRWTPPTSPTNWESGMNRGEGSRSDIDVSRRTDGRTVVSKPSANHGRHMSDGEETLSAHGGPPLPISTTTTITSGHGQAKRVVVGKKTSNPPKSSTSISHLISSSPRSDAPPTPPPKSKERLSPSPASSLTKASPRIPSGGSSRRAVTPTPSERNMATPPKPTPRSSSLRGSPSEVSISPQVPSPVRGHFPVRPPPSQASGSTSLRSRNSSHPTERDRLSTEDDRSTDRSFQEQTIRLVPASPLIGTPTLPNGSEPAPPVPAASNPIFVHTAPDEESEPPVGLGLAAPKDRELEGETDEEKGLDAARRILADDQTFKWVKENRVCEYLGGASAIQHAAVTAYMASYEFAGLKLEMAVRRLTSKLYFKAETQELDRVIAALSVRFWECNPSGLYGSSDVIHQLVYALLLLNTDLHVVDQDRKMTRDGFVENTMGSIRTWAASKHSAPPATTDITPDDGTGSVRSGDVSSDGVSGPTADSSAGFTGGKMRRNRSGSIASSFRDRLAQHGSTPALVPSQVGSITSPSASSVALKTPSGSGGDPRPSISRFGSSSASLGSFTLSKAWISDMESLLKDMYTAVKAQRILQPIGETVSSPLDKPSSSLHSSPSSLSRGMSLRSYSSNTMNSKRNSMRSLGFLTDTLGSRSRTMDNTISGRNSPTPSHATSLGDVFLGPDSGSMYHASNGATPMGFAHNLSRTIIQEHEDESDSSETSNSTAEEISDEKLALEGPPWAKEGIITRRVYLTEDGKKAKDKSWKTLFGVAQAGNLSTFTFGEGSSSGRGGTVGGGNWSSNARAQHQINLVHSFTQVLKGGYSGYSKTRSHVFSVKECTGAITYFEVGTETLVEEWTITCNYWAARLSQVPLVGGVSNMDYGWGRPTYNDDGGEEKASVSRARTISSGGGGGGISTFVNDWNSPYQGPSQSTLGEQEQFQALTAYKKKLEAELAEFKPMDRYLAHGQKARDNYSRKLAFLEAQVEKYTTYVECLGDALAARYAKRGDARQQRDLKRADKTTTKLLREPSSGLRSVHDE